MRYILIGGGRARGKTYTAQKVKKMIEKIKKLTARQREVYCGLAHHGMSGQTPHYLAIYLGYKESAYVSAQLSALVKKGLIVKIEGLKGKYTRYKIV